MVRKMKCDFSIAKKPGNCAAITLRTVYALDADRSYDVTRTDDGRCGYIALRTLRGAGLVSLRGQAPLLANANSLLFFSYDAIDRYTCCEDHWEFWWFEFESAGRIDFPLNQIIHLDQNELEIQASNLAIEMLKIDSDAANRLASAALGTLYCRWLLQYENITLSVSPYQADIQNVIMRMKTNGREPLRLAEMAASIGVCERRFRQIFKLVAGMAPKQYYAIVRAEMAEDLLRRTSLSVAEIADQLGYSSPYHFSRAFAQARGIPPSGIRKKSP